MRTKNWNFPNFERDNLAVLNTFDIILVTYNSSIYLKDYIKAINNLNYDKSKLKIYLVDNNSTDDSVEILQKLECKTEIDIIKLNRNLGFGKACNLAVKKGNGSFIFLLNPDSQVAPDTLNILNRKINNSPNEVKAWECRQSPFEHPKYYNPVTLDTEWASGACTVVDRITFEKIGGFDKAIFLYVEDVDLSWNIRMHGYQIQYVPKAKIIHLSYGNPGAIKKRAFVNTVSNNVLMRWKYGSILDVLEYYDLWIKLLLNPPKIEKIRRSLIKNLLKTHLNLPSILIKRILYRRSDNFKPRFLNWEYELHRFGSWIKNNDKIQTKSVDIVVFITQKNLKWFKETLCSIENQTVDFCNLIVIGDKTNKRLNFIKKPCKFIDRGEMDIYTLTTRAIEESNSDFISFITDQDVLFADHLEICLSFNNVKFKAVRTGIYYSTTTLISENSYIENPKILEPTCAGLFLEVLQNNEAIRTKGIINLDFLKNNIGRIKSINSLSEMVKETVSVEKTTMQFRSVIFSNL